ncbi:MAG: hypothetical protein AAF870_01320 [Pseudomonadota bacterium]
MSNKFHLFAAASLSLFALSGCVVENEYSEGISYSGGNAIAHNSSLQIIDPWPDNVQDTHLVVPAESGDQPAAEANAATTVTDAVGN